MARLEHESLPVHRKNRWGRSTRWSIATAAVILIAIGLSALPWGPDRPSSGLALADVTQRVEQTKSVCFQLRMEVDGKTVMTGELMDTGDRLRIVEGDGRIGIADRVANRGIVLDPARREYRLLNPLPTLPDVYGVIRHLEPDTSVPIENLKVDRGDLVKFRARAISVDATIFADPLSRLPVRLEWQQETALPDGRPIRGTVIADQIVWDMPVDRSRLELTPPIGFTPLPEGPPVVARPGVETDLSIEDRVSRLVNLCVAYGNTNDGCWPESLADLEAKIPSGLIKHPDRPHDEVGYAYIKPDGRTIFEPTDRRRVIVHERFDAWPGSVLVGYTDSKVERIADQAQFEALIADANRRAGKPGSPSPMENRLHDIAYACVMFGQSHEQNWPDSLDQVQPFIFTGRLKHPARPSEDIGFEYIRPAGKAVWKPPHERTMIVYERFDEWPGEITAAFTDGSTERITDPAQLNALIDQARQRASDALDE
jgi:hypothetical protein